MSLRTPGSFKNPGLLKPDITKVQTDDGCIYLRSNRLLDEYDNNLGSWLYHWAEGAPERWFVAEKGAGNAWRGLSYRDALRDAVNIGENLLALGLGLEKPLMVLSGNSLNFARLQLAGLLADIPLVPVSPAYSLMSTDFEKLKHIAGLTTPGLIYVEDADQFSAALRHLPDAPRGVFAAHKGDCRDVEDFTDLLKPQNSGRLEGAYHRIGPDSVVKILFTSGSTGLPKGVVNTQRMLCSNQQAIRQLWPFLQSKPPVLVDWLPWNHTFGSCHNFNMMLVNGGTLYVDKGKPLPGLIEASVENLKEISPSLYFNVPAGYDALLDYLEEDAGLRERFFANLDILFYAAASLGERTRRRLNDVCIKTLGETLPLLSGWGSTETAPLATGTWQPTETAGAIGQPVPGTEIKLKPFADKYEIRVKGPNVFPGYWRQPEKTKEAFDSDGYYKIGDAAVLADVNDANAGLIFQGRTAEEFKLDTGTWVSVGTLRLKIVEACAPLVQDAVIAGQDRHEIAVLLVPDIGACARKVGGSPTLADLSGSEELRQLIETLLQQYNRVFPASSTAVGRFDLVDSPLNIDAGEITDKGYINQRGVLKFRSSQIEQMYEQDRFRVLPTPRH